MKSKILIVLTIVLVLGLVAIFSKQSGNFSVSNDTPNQKPQATTDEEVIRAFMNQPNLQLTSLGTDLPTMYFRVGKVTKIGNGENMDPVEGWTRKVNVYDQKDLINGECSVYEYNTDERNHKLTAVIIKGLKQSEIDALKAENNPCVSNSNPLAKISKNEAQTIAFEYLQRAVPNFNKIKDQFIYSTQSNGESHEWLWKDKSFKLPEGLSSRPYLYPIIRISVYGNNEIQYWNTIPLFNN